MIQKIGLNTTTNTEHLDSLLERGMGAIRNSIVDHVAQHCQPTDDENISSHRNPDMNVTVLSPNGRPRLASSIGT